jgi:hypothetical protein
MRMGGRNIDVVASGGLYEPMLSMKITVSSIWVREAFTYARRRDE